MSQLTIDGIDRNMKSRSSRQQHDDRDRKSNLAFEATLRTFWKSVKSHNFISAERSEIHISNYTIYHFFFYQNDQVPNVSRVLVEY